MLIAVLTDSHDRTDRLEQALTLIKKRGITRGFHLGDFVAPFLLEQLATSGLTWQCVWGNNDGDKQRGLAMAGNAVDVAPGDFRELTVDNRSLFLTHYPEIARIAALSGAYDAVFFGHNHLYSQEVINQKTLLANPGEIYGMRYGKPSFGIYDTETNAFEHVFLELL